MEMIALRSLNLDYMNNNNSSVILQCSSKILFLPFDNFIPAGFKTICC